MVGTPWIAGVSDCWSFARRVWRERFGWDVPPVTADPADPRAARRALGVDPVGLGWQPVAVPAEGDAALMGMGRHPCHVGIWIDLAEGRHLLHSVEGAGVIVTPAGRIATLGYRMIGSYRYGGASCRPI
jgi:cell wall-associated NlpC family hydrolase